MSIYSRFLRTILLSALLTLAYAVSVRAQTQESPQLSPEAKSAVEKVDSAQRALDAKDFVAAGKTLDEVLGSQSFGQLPLALRYSSVVFASYAALGREDLLTAHEYAVAATSFPMAGGDDWVLRASVAADVQDWGDAGTSLMTLAKQWPPLLSRFDGRTMQYITSSMAKDDKLADLRLEVFDALFTANYTIEYGFEPAYFWRELVVDALAKNDINRARERLKRIDDAGVLARMRIDRRFDELVKVEPQLFDIAAVAKRRCVQIRKLMVQNPRKLALVVELLYAQATVGAFKDNVKLADQTLKTLGRAPKDKPPFEDVEEKLNWIYDLKSQSVRALGRFDESLRMQRQASELRETSTDKVSQAINLGGFLNQHGKPDEALAALEGIDWAHTLSGYGRMQLQQVRLRAYLQLGQRDEAERVLAYMRENKDDAPDTWQTALLDSGDVDAAAALYIARLRNPRERDDALWAAQSFLPLPSLPQEDKDSARWQALLERPDVTAAINEVGRREAFPIYEIWN